MLQRTLLLLDSAARGVSASPLLTYLSTLSGLVVGYPFDDPAGSTTARTVGPNAVPAAVISGATPGSAGLAGNLAFSFDGANDYVDPLNAALISVFPGAAGTLITWAKGDFTGAQFRALVNFVVDGSNRVDLTAQNVSGQLNYRYAAGGTTETVAKAGLTSALWHQYAITWSKVADEMKANFDGAQTGATQTGLGTFAGSLGAFTSIGNTSSGGTSAVWLGLINNIWLYNRVLSDAELLQAATLGSAGN
jgi:hypothetical protein